MLGRKLVAAASFVVLVSGAASAQTAASDAARTEDLVKQAVERYAAGLEASRAQNRAGRRPARPSVPHDARRRRAPRDRQQPRNGGRAAEPADLRLHARVAARELQPERDLDVRPPRQRAPADQPAESRQPERLDDDLQRGHRAEHAVGRRQLRADVQQQQGRLADTTSWRRFDPQFNSSYLFSYTQPLLRGFKIDQTRQQMQTAVINRDNAELNLKARTTNTLAAVRAAYWDYVFSIQAVDVAQAVARARVEAALGQQDSRRSRHDGADGRRAGRSGRGDAPAGADDRDRDDAHGRALAQAADRERHERSALVAAHRADRSARLSDRVDRRRRRRPVGASAAHRSADRAQRLRGEQRAAEIAARSVAARRRRARHLRRVGPRRRRSGTSPGSGLDQQRNGIARRRRLQQRARHAVQSRLSELAVCAQRELSDRRQRRPKRRPRARGC